MLSSVCEAAESNSDLIWERVDSSEHGLEQWGWSPDVDAMSDWNNSVLLAFLYLCWKSQYFSDFAKETRPCGMIQIMEAQYELK